MSSFESMAPTLANEHWGLHGGAPPDKCSGGAFGHVCTKGTNVMAERNYPCDDLIYTYFGSAAVASLDDVGETPFKRQLYQCQLAQALLMAQTHSVMRAKNWAPAYPQSAPAASSMNTFGIIVWMLNEIWPTGGWGSLEYSQAQVGSVLGGRWKPLHYFFRRTLFTDQFATCSVVLNSAKSGTAVAHGYYHFLCAVVNDSPFAFDGTYSLSAIDLRSASTIPLVELQPLKMPAGAGVSKWQDVAASTALEPEATVLVATIVNASGGVVHDNLIPLASPERMMTILAKATVSFAVHGLQVIVSTDHLALYVVLTTAAHGRFEDNAFLLKPGSRSLAFVPFAEGQEDVLRDTLRVEHLMA